MTDEARHDGVSRSEFYGVVALLFLSLFAVINLLAFESSHWVRSLSHILLFVAFLGAGMWFTILSTWERKRRKAENEAPTSPDSK
jgi:hypothetical protein